MNDSCVTSSVCELSGNGTRTYPGMGGGQGQEKERDREGKLGLVCKVKNFNEKKIRRKCKQ